MGKDISGHGVAVDFDRERASGHLDQDRASRLESLAMKVSVFGITLSILGGSFGGMYLVARLGAGDTPEQATLAGYWMLFGTAAAVAIFASIPSLVRWRLRRGA